MSYGSGKRRNRDHDLIVSLAQRIEQAIDAQSDKARQRARAWQQFKCLPTGDEIEGRSAVQSADVNSMVTAVLAQLAVSYNTDTIVSFTANNAEDEQAAKAESRAVNKVLMEDNPGLIKLLGAAQNALLYQNGYLKCFHKLDVETVTATHKGVEREDLPEYAQSEQGVERRVISYDEDTQTARVEAVYSRSRLVIDTVANERFFIDPDHEDLDLADCALAGEVHYLTRDDLVRMGVDAVTVRQLKSTQKYTGNENQNARTRNSAQVEPVVPQMDIVRCYEVYARLSFDEDEDRTYLYRCWLPDEANKEHGWLTEPEPVSRMPYACGTAFPIANQHMGDSLAEKLYQVQSGKTQLFRQWLDNVQNCSFGRFGVVQGQVQAEDLLTPRAGGAVRVKSPTAIIPIPVIDVGPSIKIALEEFDKARSERGGASLDMVGAEMQIASDTAHGTERVYAAKEILVSYMATNLAETMIKSAFLLAHAELRDGDGGPIDLKIAEQWTQVDPRSWRARTHVNVTVAPSFGERMLQANTLGMALQMYSQAMASGLEGEFVSKPGLYKMSTDWLRLNLIDDPEGYFIDPASQAAQQVAQAKQQGAQQQMAMQAQMLSMPDQIRAQVDKYKSDQDAYVKVFDTIVDAMVTANQSETQGAIDVITARTQAQAVTGAAGGGNSGAAGRSNGNGAAGNGKAAAAGGKPGKANGGNRAAAQGN